MLFQRSVLIEVYVNLAGETGDRKRPSDTDPLVRLRLRDGGRCGRFLYD